MKGAATNRLSEGSNVNTGLWKYFVRKPFNLQISQPHRALAMRDINLIRHHTENQVSELTIPRLANHLRLRVIEHQRAHDTAKCGALHPHSCNRIGKNGPLKWPSSCCTLSRNGWFGSIRISFAESFAARTPKENLEMNHSCSVKLRVST